MSTAQQRALLDELDLLLKHEPPNVRDKFDREAGGPDKYVFVKNLETVQGDERDRIFVSIGYGKDEHGRVHRNFGPINPEGGERRLNVLMTRAKLGCRIYANFHGSDLGLDGIQSKGVKVLKAFMDYYGTGEFEGANVRGNGAGTESPFEREVMHYVESLGYTVNPQVGSEGYRVDLAVVHPDEPGRYVIGIECDGASYHSSLRARDRDRLRQEILEDRGWVIHRVWSTDWFRYQAKARKEIKEAVEAAVAGNSPPPNPPAQAPPATDDGGDGNGQGQPQPVPTEPEQSPYYSKPPDDEPDANSDRGKGSDAHGAGVPSPPLPHQPAGDIAVQPEFEPENVIGGVVKGLPLQETTAHLVSEVVRQVVEVEGPVHFNRIVDRVRRVWGLGRAGKIVQGSVKRGVDHAVKKQGVHQDVNFYFIEGQETDLKKRLYGVHFTSPEEIPPTSVRMAAKRILVSGRSLEIEGLAKGLSKFLGYRGLGKKPRAYFRKEISRLLESGLATTDAMGRLRWRQTDE